MVVVKLTWPRVDLVELENLHEYLQQSTEEFEEAADHICTIVSFFRNRGYIALADELYHLFWSMENDYKREKGLLNKSEQLQKENEQNELRRLNLDFEKTR
jgi:hypothetical protein